MSEENATPFKVVEVYVDSRGELHRTEDSAREFERQYARADLRAKALRVITEVACKPNHLDHDLRGFELERLESVNAETLEPLVKYLQLLMLESEERRTKYG